MIKLLTRDEQDLQHHRLRNSDLFRHWSPLLSRMEWERHELDTMTLCREAERIIEKLRLEKEHRDEMVVYLFKQLLEDMEEIEDEHGNKLRRSKPEAECSAVTVMAMVLTSLMNAVEKGHEEETFDNEAVCVAIMYLLRNHPHFKYLFLDFFHRTKDASGREVVFTPADPMNTEAVLRQMDEEEKERIVTMQNKLLEHTASLKPLFNMHWDSWVQLCKKICVYKEYLDKLYEVVPSNNEWQMNQKMVCNLVGMFREQKKMTISVNSIDVLIANKKVASYIRNHADYKGSDSVLSRVQHDEIEKLIQES